MLGNINEQVTYFFRNSHAGFSIYKAISPIINKGQDRVYFSPCYKANLKSILYNLIFAYKNRSKRGINHVTGDTHYLIMAMLGTKSVLTIHDLVSIKNTNNPVKRWLLKLIWFELPIKFADRVTCISSETKKQLLDNFKVKAGKLKVIYNPLDPIFKFVEKDFNYKRPRILHIGTGWNKNTIAVAKALKDIECVLVVIGQLSSEILLALKDNDIVFENFVGISDQQIYEEYCKCDIVSFPSLYEGFGLPIIEGQATGRVVVTSRYEPMMEIANDGACYVDPQDIESIKKGFKDVISNPDYRKKLICNGLNNVKRFELKKIRENYKCLYRSIMS